MDEIPNYYSGKDSLPPGFELKKPKVLSKGIIYKIVDKRILLPLVYVGSSIQIPDDRWTNHTYNMKHKPQPVHKYMEKEGIENFELQVILEGKWDDELQMKKCETYWFLELNPTHNSRLPAREEKTIEQYKKNYTLKHREEVNARRREKVVCDVCGERFSRAYLYRHKLAKHS